MSSIVLDTSAFSGYLAGDRQVLGALAEASLIHLSVIVQGEILAGFRGGTRLDRNLPLLRSFLGRRGVRSLDVDADSAEIFGRVKADLGRAGTPIPINDVWIASQAIQTGSIVVTYDSHFRLVPGLRTWDRLT